MTDGTIIAAMLGFPAGILIALFLHAIIPKKWMWWMIDHD